MSIYRSLSLLLLRVHSVAWLTTLSCAAWLRLRLRLVSLLLLLLAVSLQLQLDMGNGGLALQDDEVELLLPGGSTQAFIGATLEVRKSHRPGFFSFWHWLQALFRYVIDVYMSIAGFRCSTRAYYRCGA